MNWFAKMIFDRRRNRTLKHHSINVWISFFVLGLPFFVELFLIRKFWFVLL